MALKHKYRSDFPKTMTKREVLDCAGLSGLSGALDLRKFSRRSRECESGAETIAPALLR